MRGLITLTFDDGYEAVFNHVVPLLNAYKIPAVFALPLESEALARASDEPVKPWQEWLPLRELGHEIAAHSVSHQALTGLSDEHVRHELELPAQQLGATTLVYPGGAYNEAVIKEAKKIYTAARTTQYGWQSYPPPDPWRLQTVDYTKDNWSLLKANLRVLAAVAANRWLIETYHVVDISPSTMHHSVPLTEFRRHLEFIQTLPLAIKTINEVISHRHH